MEKETLQKIYNLKKIKPEEFWASSLKSEILNSPVEAQGESKASVWDYLASPLVQNGLVVSGAFVFLIFFLSLATPLLPSNYDYTAYYPQPMALVEEEDEELREVPQDEEENIEVASVEEPVESEFAKLENTFREMQREVLGSMFNSDDPEEIAKLAIEKVEEDREKDSSMQTMTMQVEETEAEGRLEEAKELVENAQEERDYYKAFDILVDILIEYK